MPNLPPVTRALLIANGLIFLLQQLGGDYLVAHYALWPFGQSHWLPMDNGAVVNVGFSVWELVTYSFLHGGFMHIAFNMFALWMFGSPVENALGARRYSIYYFVCVVGAAVAQLAVIHYFKPHDFYPTVGASGGVFGLLLAFAIVYPRAQIFLYGVLPMPAPLLVIGYIVAEGFYGITGTQEGVAHFAHLGGAAAGFVLLRIWRAQAMNRRD